MLKKTYLIISLFLWILIIANACFKKSPTISELDFDKMPFKKLSEYGLFEGNINQMKAVHDVLPYEPAASLFTDYAFKKRFVWMPKGLSANFDPSDQDKPLDFPDKTILVKNFYYPEDFNKPDHDKRIIETRLLVKKNGKWEAYPYKWNKEQTEADHKITGGIIDVEWKDEQGIHQKIKYAMPNKNQCKSCHHRNGTFMPIGPKIKQLNHDLSYENGSKNQLEKWVEVGFLKSLPQTSQIKNLVAYNDPKASLDAKARSYLDVNCGHCHSSYGPAASSGLRLNYEESDPYHWGVKKSPVAAGMGAGTFKYDINPKKGQESIVVYRMNSTHPGIMMPEIGRVSVHHEGVKLITEWINSLNIQ